VLLDWERLEGIRQGAIAKLEPARQEFLKALDSEIGLEKDIFGGYAFNPRSNEQLLAAFQRAGIPVRDVRKESLEPLASDYPLIERYLSYHRIETQIADIEKYYPSKARKHIPWDSATGKIFPGYWQIGTISGRASSKEPNIQNPPKGEFRECVIPESGKRFVVGDYSQAHPRIVAKVSCDAAFTQVFQNGECCYSYEASTLTGKPIEQIKREHKEKTSNDRNDAKPVVLGFIYGLSPGGYVRQVQGKHTEAFARKARNQFFKTHPEVGNWHEQIQRKLDISAIATTQSGRIVELRGRNRRFNFAVNFPVLGTEADMMKSAMGFLVEEFDKLPYKVSLKIMIHDEIVVECPCGKEEEVSQILDRVMREASDLLISPIPAKVDIESGDSWVKP
jgi:DNA polymerase-1